MGDAHRDAVQQPLLPGKAFPAPGFALARKDAQGQRMPQAIAHRGYKAKFPENSMGAFAGAVAAGAHAIETDVHLTKDGVVVLSHDPTLKRCFGLPDKIIDCEWDYLRTLRTVDAPHEGMPRLADLLAFLAQPGHEDVWVLLDIKMDNDLDDVMRLIAATVAAVPSAEGRPWNQRVVIGVWAPKYLPYISTHLPTFPITFIGFSLTLAAQFLPVAHASFNLFQPMLVGPLGARFLRRARRRHRPVFAWTVNKDNAMRWSIEKGLDGVVTDDPARFLEVCREWEKEGGEGEGEGGKGQRTGWAGWEWEEWWWIVKMQVMVTVLLVYVLWLFRPWRVERRFKTVE